MASHPFPRTNVSGKAGCQEYPEGKDVLRSFSEGGPAPLNYSPVFSALTDGKPSFPANEREHSLFSTAKIVLVLLRVDPCGTVFFQKTCAGGPNVGLDFTRQLSLRSRVAPVRKQMRNAVHCKKLRPVKAKLPGRAAAATLRSRRFGATFAPGKERRNMADSLDKSAFVCYLIECDNSNLKNRKAAT